MIEQTYERITRYLKNLLSNRERHDLEQEMMRDAFDEEAFDGLNQLTARELETDIYELINRLDDRLEIRKKRNLLPFYRIAAAIILLIGIGCILYVVLKTPSGNLISQKTDIVIKQAPATPVPPETQESPSQETKKTVVVRESDQEVPVISKSQQRNAGVTVEEFITDDLQEEAAAVVTEDAIAMKANEPLELNSREITGKEITMTEDVMALNEVVVIGYGTQKRYDVTGAVSNVEARDISPTGEPIPHNYIKPLPPDGSLKEFKSWVESRIDNKQFISFPGKHRIQVNLTVHTDGSVSDIVVKNNVPLPIAKEYKRIISQSPLWQPALKDNTPVEAEVVVRFILEVE